MADDETPLEVSELFTSYEEDFQNLISSLTSRHKQYKNGSLDFKEDLRTVKQNLKECENCVKQMEFELQCLPPSIRKNYSTILTRYRSDFDQLSSKYIALQNEKNIYTHNIREQGQLLDDIEVLADNTEQIMDDVQARLLNDKEVIKSNINKNREISDELRKGTLIMNFMNRRIAVNRSVLYMTILVLFILNLLVLYLKI